MNQFVIVLILVSCTLMVSGFRLTKSSMISRNQMMMKSSEVSSMNKFTIPASVMTALTPIVANAAEGTGRAWGIDDPRLFLAVHLPLLIIFPLWLQWSKQQEGEDFFDSYERRRSG